VYVTVAAALCCAAVVLLRGVLNIVHGTHDVVNNILDHPDIAAVSFVGGDAAGRYIYGRAAANGKRVQVRWCDVRLALVFVHMLKQPASAAGTVCVPVAFRTCSRCSCAAHMLAGASDARAASCFKVFMPA
jgi:acyl-CoA reductase-like NAD-dependent aldehyde dehydrogenase